jgi:hypothetical protein
MLPRIHADITRQALGEHFSPAALEKIISANLAQDRLAGQIGHDEFHFDNNAFEKSYAYIEEQRALTIFALRAKEGNAAWSAFGRLVHTAQDFYAHSNYIDLWLSCQPAGAIPTIAEINPLDEDLVQSQMLRSGKLYYPLEALSFVKIIKPLILPLLPRDSHAWMNLDEPGRGPNFTFAFHAAIKRTRIEFEKTVTRLSQEMLTTFIDK